MANSDKTHGFVDANIVQLNLMIWTQIQQTAIHDEDQAVLRFGIPRKMVEKVKQLLPQQIQMLADSPEFSFSLPKQSHIAFDLHLSRILSGETGDRLGLTKVAAVLAAPL